MDSNLGATIFESNESPVGPMAGVPWDVRLEQLKTFKARTGHLQVPPGAFEPLRSWANSQRANLRRGYLSETRKAALDELGFDWEGRATKSAWNANLKALQEFVAQHQQVDIAYMKRFDKTLALWANRQKGQLTLGALTEEQAAQLQALGLAPAVATERRTAKEARKLREATLQEAVAYKEAHGHVQLPTSKDPESLYRRLMKLRHISVNRPDEQLRQRLVKLGAFQQFPDADWEACFEDWRLYAHLTGDYACEQQAPEHVARWAESVRQYFAPNGDALQLPLAKRYAGARSKEYLSVRNASARLAAAGFGRATHVLTEAELVCQKLSRLVGIEAGQRLGLRVVLRLLANRAERGTIGIAAQSQLKQMGFEVRPTMKTWQSTAAQARMAGAVVITPPAEKMTLLLASSRAAVVQEARRHRSRPKNLAPRRSTETDTEFRVNTRQVVAMVLPVKEGADGQPAEGPSSFATVGTASLRGRRFARPANTTFFTAVDI